jgi:hypothetical protein
MYHPSILTTLDMLEASDESNYVTNGASVVLDAGNIIGWVGLDKHYSSER